MSVATITHQELEALINAGAHADILASAPLDAIRAIYRSAAICHGETDEKLYEISCSMGIIDYVALKSLAAALRRSLSWVIRVSVHTRLNLEVYGEYGTYKPLLSEILDSKHERLAPDPRASTRDICEVEVDAYDCEPLTDTELDRFFEANDEMSVRLGLGTAPVHLAHTVNVSLSREAIGMIKILTKLKIYVTTSEFLRRAISDYLHARVWDRVVPHQRAFDQRG
jgi:hypothetical protein